MKSKPTLGRCDPDRIEAYLSGSLSIQDERSLVLHLTDCEECRDAIQDRAASPEAWLEAQTLLKPTRFDAGDCKGGNGSEFDDDFSLSLPREIQSVISALGPTDDPQMLGRLGGYEIAGVVGAGGMGVVLKAIDTSLDRTVAIKVLAPHLATSGAAKKRFAREARAAAAVLHPNVIAIHSVSNDDSTPFLVMPYVRGASLQSRLDDEGPLSVEAILRIGSQIASGLAAAHAQGIVHRDIKPANILLEQGVERVTITDFGLARTVDDAAITQSGTIAGTPLYMSPEQVRGEFLEPRSDLFSLGSVLYATCTGHAPFRAETTYGVMRRITDDSPTPIREINPDIPAWLCSIIGRLMSKSKSDRFESAAEVAALLEACLAHIHDPSSVSLPAVVTEPSAPSRSVTRSRLNKGIIAMFAVSSLGLLGLLMAQLTNPPGIAGQWTGEDWGQVVLKETTPARYEGKYTGGDQNSSGTISLKWSRIENRFNGTWRHDQDGRGGRISIRLVEDEIRGGWTTDEHDRAATPHPRLADLKWIRGGDSDQKRPVQPSSKSTDQRTLETAIAEFNRKAAQDSVGKDQPELTDEEMLSSIRWSIQNKAKSEAFLKGDLEVLQTITDTESFPKDCTLESLNELKGIGDERFQAWVIQLVLTRADGTKLVHVIRRRLMRQLDADGKPVVLPDQQGLNSGDDQTPLQAAVQGFNEAHHSVDGIAQPALTEDEVIAAIHWWKSRRNDAPVTNREFAAFQKIADSRQVPRGTEFEVIPLFGAIDGRRYSIWSVRIRMPQESKPGWTYAFVIRQQFIRVKDLDDPTAKPAFGDDVEIDVGGRVPPGLNAAQPDNPENHKGREKEKPAERPMAKLIAINLVHKLPEGTSAKVLAISPDGSRIAVGNDSPSFVAMRNGSRTVPENWQPTVDILAAKSGEVISSLELITENESKLLSLANRLPLFEVSALAFSPDSKSVAVGTTVGQFKLFDVESGELVRSLDDERARLRDERTKDPFKDFVRALGRVESLDFSPDGTLLAACGRSFAEEPIVHERMERMSLPTSGPGRLKVWDAKTGELKHDLIDHDQVFAVKFSPDGSVLASAGRWHNGNDIGTGVILWAMQTGKTNRLIPVPSNGGSHSIAFSPDGKLIAIGSIEFDKDKDKDGTTGSVTLVRVGSGITEWKMTVPGWVKVASFAMEGKAVILLAGRNSIRLVDTDTGTTRQEIRNTDIQKGVRLNDLTVNSRGRMFGVSMVDNDRQGSVAVWDLEEMSPSDARRQ